ncbi:MAG: choice-of-anchor L domain-containing protein [Neomegalonema sp.]|nr:choice-of-anchor L domain-containing protein [Neomegalonema sp.]
MPTALTSTTMTFAEAQTELGLIDSNAVAAAFLESQLGATVSNVTYTGDDEAAFLVSQFSIDDIFDGEGGLMLSSGDFPDDLNDESNHTVVHQSGGDADLTATAQAAFSGAGATEDAAVLEFTVTLENTSLDGISFDILFGSDEYPEFTDTTFTDIGAIYVNGENVALFEDDPAKPLSVIGENVDDGSFVDNSGATYNIEWDGLSTLLTVRAPLVQGENTIKIGVADTGDSLYDSGLYINNVELLSGGATGGGVLKVVNGSEDDDEIEASLASEEINLGGGTDKVIGTVLELQNDTITEFGFDDILEIEQVLFGFEDLTITLGSAILDIDTDGDDVNDLNIKMEGDFSNTLFNVENVNGNTVITTEQGPVTFTGGEARDVKLGSEYDDLLIGNGGNDKLAGAGGDDSVIGGEGNDRLLGGDGADEIDGGNGNDIMAGGAGQDDLDAGAGDDFVFGGEGDDVILGGAGIDRIFGGGGADIINGQEDDDVLNGRLGNDTILGGTGDDRINGGAGVNRVDGGLGDDKFAVAAGSDTLVFVEADFGNDLVFGFDVTNDSFEIDQIVATGMDDVTIEASGGGSWTTVSFAGGTVTLVGVNSDDVTAELFEFV